MKRRNFIKAGMFVPPIITSLHAAPSFARPGSIALPDSNKPTKTIKPSLAVYNPEISEGIHPKTNQNYERSVVIPSSSISDWKVNDWHTLKIKNESSNESSLEQHLQLIWKRLRDFFLSKRV